MTSGPFVVRGACHNPRVVRVIEVGPRDGLQNESTVVSTQDKATFVARLADAGIKEIEATSFVSPKWVPQLGDAEELWPMLRPGPKYSALVPNEKGLERAIACGVERISVFTAASEAFTKKNINMSIEESLGLFSKMIWNFRSVSPKGYVRGYVSTIVECPYSGKVSPKIVATIAKRLLEFGVDEVSLGDTTGVAVPKEIIKLSAELRGVPKDRIAWHFHDTRGTAMANVACALEKGYTAFDSSAGGLGGCPYAPGAGGNLATEDLVYFLERSGHKTGINLTVLAQASLPVLALMGRQPFGKAQLAVLSSCP